MINTSKLIASGLDTSKNEWLRAVVGLANAYNGLPQNDKEERITVLDRLLACAGEWITSHPPKATAKNTGRWNAMADLTVQIGDESEKLGVRFLTGPADWKKVGESRGKRRHYWLERLDPHHRAGFLLAQDFERWCARGLAHQTFWEYIGAPDPGDMVKYYGGTPRGLKRKVTFKNGSLYNSHDHLFDTRHLTTLHAGDGWCIFVVDTEGNLYAHKHVEAKYHHSTFLSGAPIQAAGEMVVDQGKIKVITAKSGHYAPSVKEMTRFVTLFPEIPNQAVIMPDFRTPQNWYRVRSFRFENTAAPKLKRAQALAELPLWANNADSRDFFNAIPV